MIDFRYHLVSIVAVFLALTIGIVVGTSLLQDPLLDKLNADTTALRQESEDLRDAYQTEEDLNVGAGELVDAHAAEITENLLSGSSVVLVEAPGVSTELRDALAARIGAAGGTVTGRVSFTESYIDENEFTVLDELVTQIVPEGLTLPDGGVYERAGAEVGYAVMTPDAEDERTESDQQTAQSMLASLESAGFVQLDGDPVQGAELAVLLAPEEPFAEPVTETATGAFVALAQQLDAAGVGALVVDGPGGPLPESLVAAVRAEGAEVSTFDAARGPAGQVATILALATVASGTDGQYGIGPDSDGFVPDPLPEPVPSAEPEAQESADEGNGN
ncbi:copper transporter [Allonocardiopsis opalescens]|uniref:Copper transport outer membrane protein MctB n=1 Tax=Allonocardiopsis opalescens TaxID=1144618 RepID=A0A2T0PPV0_9ACTN|nr:copper transporter [Allonocardiopsis opalescens]PRX90931.1 copper transport outer membrane protein MctB [Allonocardiopsis opalescens]